MNPYFQGQGQPQGYAQQPNYQAYGQQQQQFSVPNPYQVAAPTTGWPPGYGMPAGYQYPYQAQQMGFQMPVQQPVAQTNASAVQTASSGAAPPLPTSQPPPSVQAPLPPPPDDSAQAPAPPPPEEEPVIQNAKMKIGKQASFEPNQPGNVSQQGQNRNDTKQKSQDVNYKTAIGSLALSRQNSNSNEDLETLNGQLKQLEIQMKKYQSEYEKWFKEFSAWRKQHENHPDQKQYIEYQQKYQKMIEQQQQALKQQYIELQSRIKTKKAEGVSSSTNMNQNSAQATNAQTQNQTIPQSPSYPVSSAQNAQANYQYQPQSATERRTSSSDSGPQYMNQNQVNARAQPYQAPSSQAAYYQAQSSQGMPGQVQSSQGMSGQAQPYQAMGSQASASTYQASQSQAQPYNVPSHPSNAPSYGQGNDSRFNAPQNMQNSMQNKGVTQQSYDHQNQPMGYQENRQNQNAWQGNMQNQGSQRPQFGGQQNPPFRPRNQQNFPRNQHQQQGQGAPQFGNRNPTGPRQQRPFAPGPNIQNVRGPAPLKSLMSKPIPKKDYYVRHPDAEVDNVPASGQGGLSESQDGQKSLTEKLLDLQTSHDSKPDQKANKSCTEDDFMDDDAGYQDWDSGKEGKQAQAQQPISPRIMTQGPLGSRSAVSGNQATRPGFGQQAKSNQGPSTPMIASGATPQRPTENANNLRPAGRGALRGASLRSFTPRAAATSGNQLRPRLSTGPQMRPPLSQDGSVARPAMTPRVTVVRPSKIPATKTTATATVTSTPSVRPKINSAPPVEAPAEAPADKLEPVPASSAPMRPQFGPRGPGQNQRQPRPAKPQRGGPSATQQRAPFTPRGATQGQPPRFPMNQAGSRPQFTPRGGATPQRGASGPGNSGSSMLRPSNPNAPSKVRIPSLIHQTAAPVEVSDYKQTICKFFPTCRYKATCYFKHPPCPDTYYCKNAECNYDHPKLTPKEIEEVQKKMRNPNTDNKSQDPSQSSDSANDYKSDHNASGTGQDYNRSGDRFGGGGGPRAQSNEYAQGSKNYDQYPATSAAQRDYESTNMRQGYQSEQRRDQKDPTSSYDRYERDRAGGGPYKDDSYDYQSTDDYRGANDRFQDDRERYQRPPLQREERLSWREDQRSYDRPPTSSYDMGARDHYGPSGDHYGPSDVGRSTSRMPTDLRSSQGDRYGPSDAGRSTIQVPTDVRSSQGTNSIAGQKDSAVTKDVGLLDNKKPETVPVHQAEGKDGEEKLPVEAKEGAPDSQTDSAELDEGATDIKPGVAVDDMPLERVPQDNRDLDQPRSVPQAFTSEERPPFRDDARYPDDRRPPMGDDDRCRSDMQPPSQYQEAHGSFQRDNYADNRYGGHDDREWDRGQDRYRDQYDRDYRDIPGQRMDGDNQRLPPRDAPQGMYGRDEFDRLPPRDDPARLPPRDDLGRLPQTDDMGRLPPRDDLGRLPPRDDLGRLPPRDDLGRLPPADGLGRLPPRDDLGRMPPRDDLGRLPPRDDLGRLPPRDDFGRLPPRDEYDRLPPRDNYDRLPPRDERDRFPPRGDPQLSRYGEEPGRLPPRDGATRPHLREEIGRLSPRRDIHRSISPPRRESFREQIEFDKRYRDWEKQHFPVDDPTREWEYEMRRRELLGMAAPAPVDNFSRPFDDRYRDDRQHDTLRPAVFDYGHATKLGLYDVDPWKLSEADADKELAETSARPGSPSQKPLSPRPLSPRPLSPRRQSPRARSPRNLSPRSRRDSRDRIRSPERRRLSPTRRSPRRSRSPRRRSRSPRRGVSRRSRSPRRRSRSPVRRLDSKRSLSPRRGIRSSSRDRRRDRDSRDSHDRRSDDRRRSQPESSRRDPLDDRRDVRRSLDDPYHSKYTEVKVPEVKPVEPGPDVVPVQDLLDSPGRDSRPKQIVIILRGPPGCGKTHIAKIIKDKEVAFGSPAPRILALDDYFIQETDVYEKDEDTGKKVKVKKMEYVYEEDMEAAYRVSLLKSFNKTLDNGYFPMVIIDAINDKVEHFQKFWSDGKHKGFEVYIAEMQGDAPECAEKNIHNWKQEQVQKILDHWEHTPNHFKRLDVRSLVQDAAIEEVEMEEVPQPEPVEESAKPKGDDPDDDDVDEEDLGTFHVPKKSKWEETKEEQLAKLDGIRPGKEKRKATTSLFDDDDYDDDPYDEREEDMRIGKKRVRWADIEDRKQLEHRKRIGFCIGTDWSVLTDPNAQVPL